MIIQYRFVTMASCDASGGLQYVRCTRVGEWSLSASSSTKAHIAATVGHAWQSAMGGGKFQ
jgi:hypothetical protein